MSEGAKFMCPLCDKYASPAFCPVLRHISEVHQFEPGFVVTCGLDDCPNKYTSVSGYKTHLYRKHREFLQLNPAGGITESEDVTEDVWSANLDKLILTIDRRS